MLKERRDKAQAVYEAHKKLQREERCVLDGQTRAGVVSLSRMNGYWKRPSFCVVQSPRGSSWIRCACCRERRMKEVRANAGKMRQEVSNAHSGANQKLSNMKGTLANQAREDKEAWKEQLRKNEEARLERARANRKHAEVSTWRAPHTHMQSWTSWSRAFPAVREAVGAE